jgi:hypothetical protein
MTPHPYCPPYEIPYRGQRLEVNGPVRVLKQGGRWLVPPKQRPRPPKTARRAILDTRPVSSYDVFGGRRKRAGNDKGRRL